MKKFEERMREVLPSEELPAFFSSLAGLGARPRKSLRIRRDLSPEAAARWSPERFRDVGIPIEEKVEWYDRGFFFDLANMRPHPSRHAALAAGLIFIQEAGAMEVVPALDVRADHLVLDLCAAPGAKSSHIGEYLGPGTETAGVPVLTAPLTVATPDPRHWVLIGSLVEDLRRIHVEIAGDDASGA